MTAPAHQIVDLAARRINWRRLATSQIEALRTEAAQHGDTVMARKAARALARR